MSLTYSMFLPLVPTAPPQGVEAKAVNSTTIEFTWNPPPQQFINGINQGYKVNIILIYLLPLHQNTELILYFVSINVCLSADGMAWTLSRWGYRGDHNPWLPWYTSPWVHRQPEEVQLVLDVSAMLHHTRERTPQCPQIGADIRGQ